MMMTGNRIVGPDARAKLLGASRFEDSRLVRFTFKPFDVRWCYLDNIRPLFSEPSPQLIAEQGCGARFFVTRDAADKLDEGIPFVWASAVCDYHALDGEARHFPVSLKRPSGGLLGENPIRVPNTSRLAQGYLGSVGAADHSYLCEHALAIGYSTAYLSENRDGIRTDWPRIPLPSTSSAFDASAALGARVAELLDPSQPFSGGIRLGALSAAAGGSLDPATDLAVTARWGVAGRGGICMPSTGKLNEREYTADELSAIAGHATALGMTRGESVALLGETCFDVHLNDLAYWRCVPSAVWRYTIGGYQVIKKWLSYREHALLGRDLKVDEARYVTEMVRRIAALVLMGPELDTNYERVKADTWEWGK
ncbi:MAG: type ISP restriction/modification enzyme [Coriobacteriia bacterium]|nr:type ISP restriction/modification enzyme [Coriobacteriia bacterium]